MIDKKTVLVDLEIKEETDDEPPLTNSMLRRSGFYQQLRSVVYSWAQDAVRCASGNTSGMFFGVVGGIASLPQHRWLPSSAFNYR